MEGKSHSDSTKRGNSGRRYKGEDTTTACIYGCTIDNTVWGKKLVSSVSLSGILYNMNDFILIEGFC